MSLTKNERRSSRALLALLPLAAIGCAIEGGPPTESRETPSPQTRMDELPQPGSVITLQPEKSGRVTCPYCSAENLIGDTHCSRCSRRLSKEPVWVPCPLCGGKRGSAVDEERCPQCGGRGWIISAEESQTVGPKDDSGTQPANPDGTPR